MTTLGGRYKPTLEGTAVTLPVLDLLAAVKAIEQSDGSWPGGDLVPAVEQWLARWGVKDAENWPLSRYIVRANSVEPALRVSSDMWWNISTALDAEDERAADHEEDPDGDSG